MQNIESFYDVHLLKLVLNISCSYSQNSGDNRKTVSRSNLTITQINTVSTDCRQGSVQVSKRVLISVWVGGGYTS
jgi:hypothetical protein